VKVPEERKQAGLSKRSAHASGNATNFWSAADSRRRVGADSMPLLNWPRCSNFVAAASAFCLSRAIQDDANRVDYQRRLPSADPGNLAPGRVVAVLTMMSLKDLLKKLFGIFC